MIENESTELVVTGDGLWDSPLSTEDFITGDETWV